MKNKYKLCVVSNHYKKEVQPINEKGEEYGDTLLSYEDDDQDYYAIYENMGDDGDEDWCEYDTFDDLEDAVEHYGKLKSPVIVDYELTLCLRAGCDTDKECDNVVEYIKKLGGVIEREENDGVKRLAYEVEGEARAEFRYFLIKIPKENVQLLGSDVEHRKNVLRYLLLLNDKRSK